MGRLDFAPKRSEIKITDITRGLATFQPRAEQPVTLESLSATLKKAGYTLSEATVTARGSVEREKETWYLRVPESRQRFELRGYANLKEGSSITVEGRWTSANGVERLTAETMR